jgi:hypothetical protein
MKRLLTWILASALLPHLPAADEGDRAWIATTQNQNIVRIEAFAKLPDGRGGRYELSATKEGTSGRSVSRQAGAIRVPMADGSTPISVSQISVEDGATLNVTLIVTSESGQVYEDSYTFTGK